MKYIIQYSAVNPKNKRVQGFLKEVTNLAYYQSLALSGVIWDLEILR